MLREAEEDVVRHAGHAATERQTSPDLMHSLSLNHNPTNHYEDDEEQEKEEWVQAMQEV